MYMFLLLLFNIVIVVIRCFNIDFEYAVAKNGPSKSYFGFSVAQHLNSRSKEKWILVGAPTAENDELSSEYQDAGAVFKCKPDLRWNCTEQIPFDTDTNDRLSNKTNAWMGVSLRSEAKTQSVVTCAHRYQFHGNLGTFRLLEGQCYIIGDKLTGRVKVSSPCNSENRKTEGTPDHTKYGQCQSGIGLDIFPELTKNQKTTLLIGAAGTKWWSGEFYQTDIEDETSKGGLSPRIQNDINKKNLLDYRSSYFGFAVTYGNFFRTDVTHIASGGPRHKHFGKVLIYEKVAKKKGSTERWENKLVQAIENKVEEIQLASGYGIALCSIDSDRDGLSELIVGAPFYLSLVGKEHPERGIVYIYSKADGEDKLVEKGTVYGRGKSYSTFGYAVANCGDLNLDGFEDLSIGAPREDDGSGAVYIYYGSSTGIKQSHYQRIAATEIHSGLVDNIGLKGFGRSFGTGMDMDDNGYNDILVGAYLSDQVALLRSRPVIEVSSHLEFSPKELDAGGGECDVTKVSTCTQVKICFNISEPSGRFRSKNQAVLLKYTVEADPMSAIVRKSRMVFMKTGTNKKSFFANTTVDYQCQELGKAKLIDDKDSIIEYPDIMFKMSYQIPYSDRESVKPARSDSEVVSLDNYPILQQDMDGERENEGQVTEVYLTAKLLFKRDCTTCIPDLKVTTSKLAHTLGNDVKKPYYDFEIKIENIGEDVAYSVNLDISIPKHLTLNNIKIADKNVDSQNLINKLKKGESKIVTINLETGAFAANFDPDAQNNMSIIVSSANSELPTTLSDNRLALTFDLKIVADLRVHVTQSKSLTYEGIVKGESAMKSLEDAGPFVRHTYIVVNDGPDLCEKAVLKINWPYQTETGKHLLYLVKFEGVEGMDDVTCDTTYVNILGLRPNYNYPALEAGSLNKAVVQSKAVKSNTKSKLRIRRDVGEQQSVKNLPPAQKKGKILNCSTAQCIEIKCIVSNLAQGDSKTIPVKSLLWIPSLLLDYPGVELSVVSEAEVEIGINASYISDPEPIRNHNELFTVVTPIIPPKRKEKIAVWQIALAVAAGVILLALLIVGLYKVGFFRRTRTYDDSNGADESLIKSGRT